jgi:hypothetical protein
MRLRPSILICGSLFALASLSGCKKEEPASERSINLQEESAAVAPPSIDIKAAPGVAFAYEYAFVLPDKSISLVQEQHAAACEKLGTAQCRIIGMHYRLIADDRVEADLEFKLAPALARQFGKDGIAAVEKAEGRLVEASIEGKDVGTDISASQERSQDLAGQLAAIEGKLAGPGLAAAERTELQQQAANLRQMMGTEKQVQSEGQQQLASTPMTFRYTGNTIFAFGDTPFADAWDSTANSFKTMFAGALLIAGTLLPWLLLGLLLIMLWRTRPVRKLRRFIVGTSRDASTVAGEAETGADQATP